MVTPEMAGQESGTGETCDTEHKCLVRLAKYARVQRETATTLVHTIQEFRRGACVPE